MNETPKNMWITGGVAFLAGALIGVFSAYSIPFNSANTYQAGFNTAKTLAEKSIGVSNTDVHTLSGTVSAVSATGFMLHVQSMDPFADPALANRSVTVGSATTVIKLVQKDAKTLQSEMDAFNKATQAGGDVSKIIPPAPVTGVPAKASDIAAGDFVTVIATENISSLAEFSASQVQFQAGVATSTK
ncbi:MAG: hypothetical protein ACYC4I_02390 [Minisyncoccota bacterium]